MFGEQHILRQAIVAIIEDGNEILMIKRAAGDTYPGYWSAVTGSLEEGEDQRECCIREALEEVGLIVQPVRKVWESVTRGGHFALHWWLCRLAGPREVKADPKEVGDYRWVRREEMPDIPLMFSDSRWFYREIYPFTRRDD